MYFDKMYCDENGNPSCVQLICNKCGNYIEEDYDENVFGNITNDYAIVNDGSKILCKCGNKCQNGMVEPKKIVKIEHSKTSSTYTNIPHCPYCNSTDLTRITTLGRLTSVGVFGLASNKINKNFKCNNCKATF